MVPSSASGTRPERVERLVAVQVTPDTVRELQDDAVRSSVEGERQRGRISSVALSEVPHESIEVQAGCSSPLVDGLVGVTDSCDWEPVAEYRSQELALGGIGVLVFIEEDDAIAVAYPLCDCRVLGDELVGATHKIGIVHDAKVRLRLHVTVHNRQQLEAGRPDIVERIAGRCRLLHRCGVEQVVPDLPSQGEGLVDDALRIGEVEVLVRVRSEAFFEKLALVSRADHSCVSFYPDQSTEFLQQTVGKTVIGGHLNLTSIGCEVGEFGSETLAEFPGGLVGERDAESGLWFDTLSDQGLESQHDRGRFAGPRPRRHPERDQCGIDDVLLLRCEMEAHETKASLPSGTAGHASRTGQRRHRAPGVGVQSSFDIPCATAVIRFSI